MSIRPERRALYTESYSEVTDRIRFKRAGDALMRVEDQLPRGAWRCGLEERGISKSTAQRFISLRKKYPEMSQIGTFSSVSAALVGKAQKEKPPEPQLQQEPPPSSSTRSAWHGSSAPAPPASPPSTLFSFPNPGYPIESA